MTPAPLVSIIIRTIDRPELLKEAILSVYLQDYQNIQTIVINDGGPSLKDKIGSWVKTKNFKLLEFPYNLGRSAAGNAGLNFADGDFLGFLDDDDIFYPFHVSSLVDGFNKSAQAIAIYNSALRANQIPRPYDLRRYITVDLTLDYSVEFDHKKLQNDNFLPIETVLFKKTNHRFDERLDAVEDWDFWKKLANDGIFVHQPIISAEHRIRADGSNISGKLDHIWKFANILTRNKGEKHDQQ